MTVRHQAFQKKLASEAAAQQSAEAAKQYNKEQKLKMQKIAKATAKRMITRRSEQASNKARREEGSAKRERRVRRTRRNERQAGLTTAEIRAKREKKGIGKFAKKTKKGGIAKGSSPISGIVAGVQSFASTAPSKVTKTERPNRQKNSLKSYAKSRNEANRKHSDAVKSYYKSARKPKQPRRKPKRGKQIN